MCCGNDFIRSGGSCCTSLVPKLSMDLLMRFVSLRIGALKSSTLCPGLVMMNKIYTVVYRYAGLLFGNAMGDG